MCKFGTGPRLRERERKEGKERNVGHTTVFKLLKHAENGHMQGKYDSLAFHRLRRGYILCRRTVGGPCE